MKLRLFILASKMNQHMYYLLTINMKVIKDTTISTRDYKLVFVFNIELKTLKSMVLIDG